MVTCVLICCARRALKRGLADLVQGEQALANMPTFIVYDPSTGKILGLCVMKESENTQHVLQMLDAVVWLYPKLNIFVYDRACSIVCAAHEEDTLGKSSTISWIGSMPTAIIVSVNATPVPHL